MHSFIFICRLTVPAVIETDSIKPMLYFQMISYSDYLEITNVDEGDIQVIEPMSTTLIISHMLFRFEPYHSMRKVDAVNDFEQIRKYVDGNVDHDLNNFMNDATVSAQNEIVLLELSNDMLRRIWGVRFCSKIICVPSYANKAFL